MTPSPTFEELFGRPPAVQARAPGHVNLMGEHTDYNGGFALAMAIPQELAVELAPAAAGEVRAFSVEMGGAPESFTLGREARGRGWLDRVQGVTATLARDGHTVSGFDLRISSRVPAGAGLGSSAALVVAVLRALRQAFALRLDDLALAQAAHRAESEFMGAPGGILDPMASSLADPSAALLVDTRTLAHERLPLPREVEPLVVASGSRSASPVGGMRARRDECARAAALLGVGRLGDLGERDLSRSSRLPEPLPRRVRHVVREDARVLDAADALRRGDADYLGALFDASHASQRDDFEVSTPEIDVLVALARAQPEVLGARLTGGGFGGSIVALARADTAAAVGRTVVERYARLSGLTPALLVPAPA